MRYKKLIAHHIQLEYDSHVALSAVPKPAFLPAEQKHAFGKRYIRRFINPQIKALTLTLAPLLYIIIQYFRASCQPYCKVFLILIGRRPLKFLYDKSHEG